MIVWPAKAPAAVADFAFDFSGVLAEAETIQSKAVIPEGVTVDSSTIAGGEVQVWLSGGVAGTVARVACTITTSGGRTFAEVAVLEIGGEAVSLATAKAAQRIEDDDEDALLAGFLRAAIGHVERVTGKNLTAKVETQVVDRFPLLNNRAQGVRLFRGPVTDIVSVKYDDGNAVEQDLASFRLVEGRGAQLLPGYGELWPTTALGAGAVRVTYVAGYEPGDRELAEISHAAVLLFGHYNANREAVVAGNAAAAIELPLGVKALLAPFMAPGIA